MRMPFYSKEPLLLPYSNLHGIKNVQKVNAGMGRNMDISRPILFDRNPLEEDQRVLARDPGITEGCSKYMQDIETKLLRRVGY